jgi:two-component system response regulator AlgR
MNILIVDDEALARDRLRALLQEIKAGSIVGEAATGAQALQLSESLQPDVILMDIRMPGMNGIEAAMHLEALDKPPAVIFTTAYGDHALEAFETHAIDYLLKPIRKERLRKALQAATRLNRSQLSSLQGTQAPTARTHISARVHGNIQLIPLSDIYYFMADQKYVSVRHRHGRVLIDEPLKSLESEFARRFLRIHRSTLVAREAIKELCKDAEGRCILRLKEIDEPLTVSRSYVAQLRKFMKG